MSPTAVEMVDHVFRASLFADITHELFPPIFEGGRTLVFTTTWSHPLEESAIGAIVPFAIHEEAFLLHGDDGTQGSGAERTEPETSTRTQMRLCAAMCTQPTYSASAEQMTTKQF